MRAHAGDSDVDERCARPGDPIDTVAVCVERAVIGFVRWQTAEVRRTTIPWSGVWRAGVSASVRDAHISARIADPARVRNDTESAAVNETGCAGCVAAS